MERHMCGCPRAKTPVFGGAEPEVLGPVSRDISADLDCDNVPINVTHRDEQPRDTRETPILSAVLLNDI
jgi:hypothetical protein